MYILKGRAVSREAQDRGGAGKEVFLHCHVHGTDHKGSQPYSQTLAAHWKQREDWTLRLYCEEQVRREDTGVSSVLLSIILGSRFKNLRLYQGR